MPIKIHTMYLRNKNHSKLSVFQGLFEILSQKFDRPKSKFPYFITHVSFLYTICFLHQSAICRQSYYLSRMFQMVCLKANHCNSAVTTYWVIKEPVILPLLQTHYGIVIHYFHTKALEGECFRNVQSFFKINVIVAPCSGAMDFTEWGTPCWFQNQV